MLGVDAAVFLFVCRRHGNNFTMPTGYRLVRLRNGTSSVHALAENETFHPGIGPVAEAEALYLRQLRLPERVRKTRNDFVIWDVGLGAAANALTTIRILSETSGKKIGALHLISFDHTTAAAEFALTHAGELGYVTGFEAALSALVRNHSVKFNAGALEIDWTLVVEDFPAWVQCRTSSSGRPGPDTLTREFPPAPHAILFDPHSPKKNPAMWSVRLFAGLSRQLDPERPCTLATFTRSTMARVALLLGGFFVGVGHPSGLKEETTVAANRLELLDEPLDPRWLDRLKRSGSAEPLRERMYRQAPLLPETLEQLRRHPQFQ